MASVFDLLRPSITEKVNGNITASLNSLVFSLEPSSPKASKSVACRLFLQHFQGMRVGCKAAKSCKWFQHGKAESGYA